MEKREFNFPYGNSFLKASIPTANISCVLETRDTTGIENEFKASAYIRDAVVIGDGRKYLTALILIEYDNVGKWAEDNRVSYTTFKDLSQKPEVFELVSQITKEVNSNFAQVETIKKFTILDKELDQDDDELTATQKVRRKIIEEKYKDTIASMY